MRRWDTTEHAPDDPRRVAYGKPYPPFHDLMVAVDGEAAQALRQHRARALAPRHRRRLDSRVASTSDPWPPALDARPARTSKSASRAPCRRATSAPAVREVEQLYLDMIAAARREIYIENQYFTSPRIAAALERRLAEPDGPEIVLVLRLLSHGWLEEATMHVLRTRLIQRAERRPTATGASMCTTRTSPASPRAAASTCTRR